MQKMQKSGVISLDFCIPRDTLHVMNTFHETPQFAEWLENFSDLKGKMRVIARVNRARTGNFSGYSALTQ
jgi:hypothetical protein